MGSGSTLSNEANMCSAHLLQQLPQLPVVSQDDGVVALRDGEVAAAVRRVHHVRIRGKGGRFTHPRLRPRT